MSASRLSLTTSGTLEEYTSDQVTSLLEIISIINHPHLKSLQKPNETLNELIQRLLKPDSGLDAQYYYLARRLNILQTNFPWKVFIVEKLLQQERLIRWEKLTHVFAQTIEDFFTHGIYKPTEAALTGTRKNFDEYMPKLKACDNSIDNFVDNLMSGNRTRPLVKIALITFYSLKKLGKKVKKNDLNPDEPALQDFQDFLTRLGGKIKVLEEINQQWFGKRDKSREKHYSDINELLRCLEDSLFSKLPTRNADKLRSQEIACVNSLTIEDDIDKQTPKEKKSTLEIKSESPEDEILEDEELQDEDAASEDEESDNVINDLNDVIKILNRVTSAQYQSPKTLDLKNQFISLIKRIPKNTSLADFPDINLSSEQTFQTNLVHLIGWANQCLEPIKPRLTESHSYSSRITSNSSSPTLSAHSPESKRSSPQSSLSTSLSFSPPLASEHTALELIKLLTPNISIFPDLKDLIPKLQSVHNYYAKLGIKPPTFPNLTFHAYMQREDLEDILKQVSSSLSSFYRNPSISQNDSAPLAATATPVTQPYSVVAYMGIILGKIAGNNFEAKLATLKTQSSYGAEPINRNIHQKTLEMLELLKHLCATGCGDALIPAQIKLLSLENNDSLGYIRSAEEPKAIIEFVSEFLLNLRAHQKDGLAKKSHQLQIISKKLEKLTHQKTILFGTYPLEQNKLEPWLDTNINNVTYNLNQALFANFPATANLDTAIQSLVTYLQTCANIMAENDEDVAELDELINVTEVQDAENFEESNRFCQKLIDMPDKQTEIGSIEQEKLGGAILALNRLRQLRTQCHNMGLDTQYQFTFDRANIDSSLKNLAQQAEANMPKPVISNDLRLLEDIRNPQQYLGNRKILADNTSYKSSASQNNPPQTTMTRGRKFSLFTTILGGIGCIVGGICCAIPGGQAIGFPLIYGSLCLMGVGTVGAFYSKPTIENSDDPLKKPLLPSQRLTSDNSTPAIPIANSNRAINKRFHHAPSVVTSVSHSPPSSVSSTDDKHFTFSPKSVSSSCSVAQFHLLANSQKKNVSQPVREVKLVI